MSIGYFEPETALVARIKRYAKAVVLDFSFRFGNVLTAVLTANHEGTRFSKFILHQRW